MKENKITIKIERPVSEVFVFALNPANTPKWIDSIVEEKASDSPAKKGTIYKNKNKDGIWNEYEVVELTKNKSFTMKQKNSAYSVKYTFKALPNGSTELTYFEWVDEGELEGPFTKSILNKLKRAIEIIM